MKGSLFKSYIPHLVKIGQSVSDQALISATNFFLNIFLARWLAPNEYGTFAILFSVFLFISSFYNALIVEPMNVIGSRYFGNRLLNYITTAVFQTQSILSVIVFVPLVAIMLFLEIWGYPISRPFWFCILNAPFILLYYTLRRSCYVLFLPNIALVSSIIYAFSSAVLLYAWRFIGYHSSQIGFIILGIASVLASLSIIAYQKPWKHSPFKAADKALLYKYHWRYGKWALLIAVIYWFSSAFYLPLTGIFIGMEEAGAFRAIQNYVLPFGQLLTSLSILALPILSKRTAQDGLISYKKRIICTAFLLGVMACIYSVIVFIYQEEITSFLYKGNYSKYLWMLPVIAMSSIITAFSQPFEITLKAIDKPKNVAISQINTAICSLSLGIYLMYRYGLSGAIAGPLLCSIILLISYIFFFTRTVRLRDQSQ